MTMTETERTRNSTTASIRSRVRIVSGRKVANSRAFHTHAHLSHAESGNSARIVVIPQYPSNTTIRNWRRPKRESRLSSNANQPPKASTNAISDTGIEGRIDQAIFCGATISM